ncbi:MULTISPECIES: aminoglycoside phosphotransferase family protein [Pseudoalteromonas]|uniref:aminoglycoside phosphotransferase family protein n=1 Tax=Pseudoalteromonas TaxID=53246 RepID=UPI0002FE73BA|nr:MULTISPECIES: aminoglycoside phosphotransferase family protein [Pseudoalteromonas]MDP4488565.1 aminoglycoside phosphotransferase family protein [Pseudoalteromonas piscicida]
MFSAELTDFISSTLGQTHWRSSSLPQGANNQGHKLFTENNAYFLKCFAPDARAFDKLYNEFQFSQQLHKAGISNIARPIGYCSNTLSAIYEFIDGHTFETVTAQDVRAAYNFIAAINSHQVERTALNAAADSPAKLEDFIQLVTLRLSRFEPLRDNAELNTLLTAIELRTRVISTTPGIDWQQPCPKDVVSPSDFGFHNALKYRDDVYFIDFEYAGNDSAWKLLCDFFAQPAVPVPLSYLPLFLRSPLFAAQASAGNTLKCVFELTLLKWCLIMLNEFLPDVQARRLFSWNISCLEERNAKLQNMQAQQLDKSQRYFAQINDKMHALQTQLRDN